MLVLQNGVNSPMFLQWELKIFCIMTNLKY